jgi:hypothetical protein
MLGRSHNGMMNRRVMAARQEPAIFQPLERQMKTPSSTPGLVTHLIARIPIHDGPSWAKRPGLVVNPSAFVDCRARIDVWNSIIGGLFRNLDQFRQPRVPNPPAL